MNLAIKDYTNARGSTAAAVTRFSPSTPDPIHHLIGGKPVPTYSLGQLRETYEHLEKQSYEGIRGVIKISSGKPGPTLGITVCTHGNEPSGFAPVRYLLEEANIGQSLERGTIFFVLNNIEAARASFDAEDFHTRLHHRFVQKNMNRLPFDVLEREDEYYEHQRARELYSKVYCAFDAAIDLHSTTLISPPMLVDINPSARELYPGVPVATILSEFRTISISMPVAELYGGVGREIPAFVLEAGSHEDEDAFDCAVRTVNALLHNLDMVDAESRTAKKSSFIEYRMLEGLHFPDRSYEYVRVFSYFETLAPGQLIAKNHSQEIRCSRPCKIVFGGTTKAPVHITEEAAFFVSLPKIIQL